MVMITRSAAKKMLYKTEELKVVRTCSVVKKAEDVNEVTEEEDDLSLSTDSVELLTPIKVPDDALMTTVNSPIEDDTMLSDVNDLPQRGILFVILILTLALVISVSLATLVMNAVIAEELLRIDTSVVHPPYTYTPETYMAAFAMMITSIVLGRMVAD